MDRRTFGCNIPSSLVRGRDYVAAVASSIKRIAWQVQQDVALLNTLSMVIMVENSRRMAEFAGQFATNLNIGVRIEIDCESRLETYLHVIFDITPEEVAVAVQKLNAEDIQYLIVTFVNNRHFESTNSAGARFAIMAMIAHRKHSGENADFFRAALRHPSVREFVGQHGDFIYTPLGREILGGHLVIVLFNIYK